MKNKKATYIVIALIAVILIIAIIALYVTKKQRNTNYTTLNLESTDLNIEYTDKELTGEWKDYNAKITLSDNKVNIEGKGVSSSNNTIKITSAGTYYLTGNISDGNILIETTKNDNVQLVLDNVSITSQTTAPINCVEADKLTITLQENSTNTIADSSNYTTFTDTESQEPDGAIFTKSDLIINGNGKLIVNANYKDGIVSKDGLKIINTNIEVISADDGIRGKDYVAINNANISINSKGDAIKSTNNVDSTLGYIAIEGGKIDITSETDGIQAETVLNISNDANVNITTTGVIDSPNSKDNFGFGMGMNKQKNTTQTTSNDSATSKALKAGTEITIDSGTFNIKSTDDSIHSNGIIIINSGTINISSGDDGIHADTNIAINGGNIDITKSYEGIESSYIEINNGTISVVATDDGINISGGNDASSMGGRMGQNNFSSVEDSNRKLIINNGNITVDADGDGLDANGAIYINGGNIHVAGPTNSGNGALDYDSECAVNGGTFVVYGAAGMWQNPSNSSTQYSLTFQASGNAGDEIILKNSLGDELISTKTLKAYQVITFSDDNIKNGETYYLYINGENIGSLKSNSVVTSNSSSGGMGMNNMHPNNMQQNGMKPNGMNGKGNL